MSWYQLNAPSVLTFFLEQQHQRKCPYIWAKWRLCIYSLEAPLAAKMIFFSPGNIFRERWMPQGRKTWAISQVGLMICPQSNSILEPDAQNLRMMNGRFLTFSSHFFPPIIWASFTKLRFRWSLRDAEQVWILIGSKFMAQNANTYSSFCIFPHLPYFLI